MRSRLCSAATVLCVTVGLAAVSFGASETAGPRISGNWRPNLLPKNGSAVWRIDSDKIGLQSPAGDHGEYEIVSDQTIPAGDWTLEFGFVGYGGFGTAGSEVQLMIGDPESQEGSIKLAVNAGKGLETIWQKTDGRSSHVGARERLRSAALGPVQLVQVAYSSRQSLLCFTINGKQVTSEATAAPPAEAPIRIRVHVIGPLQDALVEIVSFKVHPEARIREPVRGMAWEGWTKPLSAEALRSSPDLISRIETLLGTPGLGHRGQACALASLVLAERAISGHLSDKRWERVADFVGGVPEEDRGALLHLLPIAIASGNSNQRQTADPWLMPFRGMVYYKWDKISGSDNAIAKLSLIDANLALELFSEKTSRFRDSFRDELMTRSPQSALALYTPLFVDEPNALAWFLPDLKEVYPEYYQYALEYLRDLSTRKQLRTVEPDRFLSFAAYRLSSVDPSVAMEMWERIESYDVKAETMQYMAERFITSSPDTDRRVEAVMKDAIEKWKPKRKGESPVSQYLRLASWYKSRGRTEEARAIVREATAKASTSSDRAFNDTHAIVALMKELEMPEAAEWWAKAVSLAVEADRDADERTSQGVYVSAVALLHADLLNEGRVEEALEMRQRIDPERLRENHELCMSSEIRVIAKTDMARALAMLDVFPSNVRRDYLITALVSEVAANDLDTAIRLLDKVSPGAASDAAFRIAEVVPLENSQAVRTIIEDAISSGVKSLKHPLGTYVGDKLSENLSKLSVPTLLSLESAFGESREDLAFQLLTNTVRSCGLADDPVWQRFSGNDSRAAVRNPWRVDLLRYAVISEGRR